MSILSTAFVLAACSAEAPPAAVPATLVPSSQASAQGYVINLNGVQPRGGPFSGPAQVAVTQGLQEELRVWGPFDVVFDASGAASLSVNSFEDIDLAKTVWVEVRRPGTFGLDVFATADEGTRGLRRVYLGPPDAAGSSVTTLANLSIIPCPAYAKVEVVGASDEDPFELLVSPLHGSLGHGLVANEANGVTTVYSWRADDSMRLRVASLSTGEPAYRGLVYRGESLLVDPDAVGAIAVSTPTGVKACVALIPIAEYEAITAQEAASKTVSLIRVGGRWTHHELPWKNSARSYGVGALTPGEYVLEVWSSYLFDQPGPYYPLVVRNVTIAAGTTVQETIP